MAFFDDFASGISGYPAASVTLSIVSLTAQPPSTPGAVNVNEVWSFRIMVQNNGNLNMKNVVLQYRGLSGALVSPNLLIPFSAGPLMTATLASVPAHGSGSIGLFYFKAPATQTATPVQLIEAHLAAWDADLDHLLNNHSGAANPPQCIYSEQVYP